MSRKPFKSAASTVASIALVAHSPPTPPVVLAGVDYHAPFGGTAGSSYGPREQGRAARAFYTTVKTSYQNAV